MASPEDFKISCRISDRIREVDDPEEIHSSICRDLRLTKHSDDYYCLLHLPVKEKDTEEFYSIFISRLEGKADKKRNHQNESIKTTASHNIRYDFRYVWFPINVDLGWYRFLAKVDFSSAVFSGAANFRSVTFSGDADFSFAVFSGDTSFENANFIEDSDFKYSSFLGNTYFRSARFSGEANFTSTTYSKDTVFESATFNQIGYFNKSVFKQKTDFHKSTFMNFAGFANVTFSSETDFRGTRFLSTGHFNASQFSKTVLFYEAKFIQKVEFSRTIFSEKVLFKKVLFHGFADFSQAIFDEKSEIMFEKSQFCGRAVFDKAIFLGYVSFTGDEHTSVFLNLDGIKETSDHLRSDLNELDFKLDENDYAVLSLQEARLESPEKISFHTVGLRPNWFVNTDSREMRFTDCHWENNCTRTVWEFLKGQSVNKNISSELKALNERDISDVSEGKRLLEIACRQLAVNAEENNRYEDASKFRYMAMETKRLEYWWQGRFWTLTWWYRLSSGYGENWGRAAGMLLALLIGFGLLFGSSLSRFEKPEKLLKTEIEKGIIAADSEERDVYKMPWQEGTVHSLFVAALQRPEPKPYDTQTRFFVIMETILGPLQAALLALAIRRKFMR